jgi:hypothetical protein
MLAFLVILVLAAFGSSPSAYESAAPAGLLQPLPAGRPHGQLIAYERGSGSQSLALQLAVAQDQLTAIGYHGGGADALPLDPVGRQANESLFPRLFHRVFGGGGGGPAWYQLSGGEGSSTGAVDVGAAAGTDVYSPVDGIVTGIQDEIVNGKVYASILQIQPQGSPSVVVTIRRIGVDPALGVGSTVAARTSRIGMIVDFSGVERQALAAHTQDTGNHVTISVQSTASASP